MKKNMLPSLRMMTAKIVSQNCVTFLHQSAFMGPKQTLALKQTSSFSSLDISKQAVYPTRTGGSLIDRRKVRPIVPKGALNSKRLQMCNSRNGLEVESCKIRVVVLSTTGDVLGTFRLEQFQKTHAENGYEMEPFDVVITLEELLVSVFEFAYMQSIISKAFFQQLPPQTNVFAKKDLLKKCVVPDYMQPMIMNGFHPELPSETREFAKDLPEECSVSAFTKPTTSSLKAVADRMESKEFAKNSEDFCKPSEKSVVSTTSDNNTESQTSGPLPDRISSKGVRTCHECREGIKMKKFFDERRFGILEKCDCALCYGCIRKLTGASNGVVKGPVRCPICFVKSANVASSACWIEGKEKDEFFKKYCKNLEYANIKLKLGWTCFPTRKNDMKSRMP